MSARTRGCARQGCENQPEAGSYMCGPCKDEVYAAMQESAGQRVAMQQAEEQRAARLHKDRERARESRSQAQRARFRLDWIAPRQRQAADLRAQGLSLSEIGARLGITRGTVARDIAAAVKVTGLPEPELIVVLRRSARRKRERGESAS